MAWCCYMLAVVAVVFSGCFQTVHSWVNITGTDTVFKPARTICQTPECNSTAAALMAKMNLSADPCEDFNEFACGRFIEESVIPNGTIALTIMGLLAVNNSVILNEVLVNTTNPKQLRYLDNMRRMYKACLNTTQIEVVGLTPYLNDRAFVDDWPTLNPRWSEAGFDLNDLIARYARVFTFPIFTVRTIIDWKNTTRYLVDVTQPTLQVDSGYHLQLRNYSVILAYERYLAEIAIELNASRDVAEGDARDVVNLEIDLARIFVLPAQRRDYNKQVNRIKLNQFSLLYPRLDIARVIRSTFSAANISLPDDEIVNIDFPAYMKDIESVLECFPKRL